MRAGAFGAGRSRSRRSAGLWLLRRSRRSRSGTRLSWPEKLAVSRDGSRLLVALNLADSAAVVDLNQGDQVHYVALGSGSYPFGAAILPDGRTGLVTNEGDRDDVGDRHAERDEDRQHSTLARRCRIPQGVVVDSAGTRAYVALSNADQVAVVNLSTRRVARTISVGSSFGLGTIPVALAMDPSGARLFVAESGADALAVDPPAGQGNAGEAGLDDRRSRPDGRGARSGAHHCRASRPARSADLDRCPGRRHRATSRGPQPRESQRPDLLGVSPDPPAEG